MNQHRYCLWLLLTVCFCWPLSVIGNVTTGAVTAGGQTTSVDITHGLPADLPVTYFDAWNTIGGFQTRQYSIYETHIGFGDLRHSAVSKAYGIPVSPPTRFFRKQTGTSSWSVTTPTTTWNGSFNFVMGKTPFGNFLVSTAWQDVRTQNVEQANEFGTPLGVWYTITTTLFATPRPNPPQGVPVFDGYRLTHYEEPGRVDTTSPFSGRRISLTTNIGENYATRDSFFTSTPQGVWAAQPNPWTESVATWHVDGYDYTIALSEEDTLAEIQSRITQDRALASLESIPWTKNRYVQNGEVLYEFSGYTDNVSLFNYAGDLTTTGEFNEERAQLRFVVPQQLRIPGVGYRGRIIEYFYPRTDPTHAQIVKIHEVDMREGQWESPIINPVMHPGDGRTVLKNFSAVAELIQPHSTLVLPLLGGGTSSTAPAEYQSSKPTFVWQSLATDSGGAGQISRQVLTGSATLQQINLSDAQGALGTWSQATAKWSVLPGATAQVRLWLWTDDGTALGTWRLLTTDDDLRTYYGSSNKFVFAEATTAGQATIRITIKLNDQEIHDDLLVTAAALHASLAVDANRDGTIELPPDDPNASYADASTTAKPYRFWLNDDIDLQAKSDPANAGDENPYSGTKNWDDNIINGLRDLEDFTRLNLYLGGLQDAVVSGQIKVGLKWKNPDSTTPSIKVWRNLSPNGGRDYLTDVNVGGQHLSLRDPGLVKDAIIYIIPMQYWTDVGLSASQPYGNLLFEGCSTGKGQLVMVLLNSNDTEIGEGASVWIELKQFNELYEHWTCGDTDLRDAAIASTPDHAYGSPFEYGPGFDGLSLPAAATYNDYVLFVHGWRMQPWERRAYAETAFKRMYHQGYKGKFGLFSWPTEWVDLDHAFITTTKNALSDPQHYDRSEVVARKSGAVPLHALLVSLNTRFGADHLHVFAHSMGNVVVSEALRSHQASTPLINAYIACQSAEVAHAYDQNAASKSDLSVIPNLYCYNPPNPRTNYEQLKEGDNYHKGLASRANSRFVSFANLNDQALGKWDLNQLMKPDDGWYPSDTAYSYVTSLVGNFFDTYREDPPGVTGSNLEHDIFWPTDRFTILAHIVPAHSRATGATIGIAGEFNPATEVNLDAEAYQFGGGDYSHSAEFLSNFAERRTFYFQLLTTFRLSPDRLNAP